jgi:hypothetical protein
MWLWKIHRIYICGCAISFVHSKIAVDTRIDRKIQGIQWPFIGSLHIGRKRDYCSGTRIYRLLISCFGYGFCRGSFNGFPGKIVNPLSLRKPYLFGVVFRYNRLNQKVVTEHVLVKIFFGIGLIFLWKVIVHGAAHCHCFPANRGYQGIHIGN